MRTLINFDRFASSTATTTTTTTTTYALLDDKTSSSSFHTAPNAVAHNEPDIPAFSPPRVAMRTRD
jgi:hypothetical protein